MYLGGSEPHNTTANRGIGREIMANDERLAEAISILRFALPDYGRELDDAAALVAVIVQSNAQHRESQKTIADLRADLESFKTVAKSRLNLFMEYAGKCGRLRARCEAAETARDDLRRGIESLKGWQRSYPGLGGR